METYSKWGDVSYIGLRTTRVRSTDGVLLTIPNKILTKDAVANFSHSSDMELRVRIRLGLTATWANVTKAEEIVQDIADNHPEIVRQTKTTRGCFERFWRSRNNHGNTILCRQCKENETFEIILCY